MNLAGGPHQPVADVAQYLKERKPVAHFRDEICLWMRVPSEIAREVRVMLDSFDLVIGYTARPMRLSVAKACARALTFYSTWNWKLKTYRAKFDLWQAKRDWLVLVNRSKCGAAWQDREIGIADETLRYFKHRIAAFKRRDGKLQAYNSLCAQWRTGLNLDGLPEVIPGLTYDWGNRNRTLLPAGFSYDNLMRQLAQRDKLTEAERALLQMSVAAATENLPFVLGTRAGLRFMEEITIDDLRADHLVFNPATGEAEEEWWLIARDSATGMVLGGVQHLRTVREDGSKVSLGARQMKELAAQLLQTYPLPPYVVTWVLERGTATLDAEVRAALGELLNQRVKFRITSMLGGKSPVGYEEKAKGNSRGKASHESHNRLYHTQGSFLPGQTGSKYEIRPADLTARIEECKRIVSDLRHLPEHLRHQAQFPMLTPAESREWFKKFSHDQNRRTDHKLEGYAEVLEWYDPQTQSFQPRETIPNPLPWGAHIQRRLEMPVERAARLAAQVSGWEPVNPQVVIAFLAHTQRRELIEPNGEIKITIEGRVNWFRHGGVPLTPGMEVIAYLRTDEPDYMLLTDGRGGVLGVWFNRTRVRHNDNAALANAIRYTKSVLADAQAEARDLVAPETRKLAAMREHNSGLADFITITPPEAAKIAGVNTAAGAALTEFSNTVKADLKRGKKKATAEATAAAADIFAAQKSAAAEVEPTPDNSAAADILAAFQTKS